MIFPIKKEGFLASEGGTFALGDNASISYTSTKPLAISPGSSFKLGSGAKITFTSKVDLVGTATDPIRFERLGSGAWDRLYVRGAGSTLKFLSVTGGNVGVQLQASNTSLASSFIEGNGTGVSVQDYAGVAPSGVTLTGNTIRSNSTRGVRLWNGAQATLSGNNINSNTNEGVQVDGSTTQATITANTISLNTGAGIRIKTGASAIMCTLT
jgi:parallel beta-helix repeat protein